MNARHLRFVTSKHAFGGPGGIATPALEAGGDSSGSLTASARDRQSAERPVDKKAVLPAEEP